MINDSIIRSGEEFLEEPTLYSGNHTRSSHVYLPFYEAQKLQTSKSFESINEYFKTIISSLNLIYII